MSEEQLALALAAANAAWLWARRGPFERYYGVGLPGGPGIGAWFLAGAAVGMVTPTAMPILMLGALSALSDASCGLLPLGLTLAMTGETAVLLAATGPPLRDEAWLCAAVWVVPLFLGASAGAVGWGDVLFAIPLGLWGGMVGVPGTVLGVFMAFAGAALWSLLPGVGGLGPPRERVPLGPFLWAGSIGGWPATLGMGLHLSAVCEKLASC